MSWTPLVGDGALGVRYKTDPSGSKNSTTLLKQTVQPDRDLIMGQIANERKAAEDGDARKLSFGRYVGSIPLIDFLRIQKTHPDLFSPDREIARKATIKFFNSSEGAPYRVQKA